MTHVFGKIIVAKAGPSVPKCASNRRSGSATAMPIACSPR
jgi:hypothetical protein